MFSAHEMEKGKRLFSKGSMYPSELICFCGGEARYETPFGHYFAVVVSGSAVLRSEGRGEYPLIAGMYFSVPENLVLRGDAKIALFLRYGYRGLFSIGGPIEEEGRLCYIDNSSTTILCPPPRNGDPCLNLLTFPKNIKQTQHIHPTIRLGVVVAGSGDCLMGESAKVALAPGKIFMIAERSVHSFESGPNGLSVIAYHPDSEGGPTDHSHPMLNRTYLDR